MSAHVLPHTTQPGALMLRSSPRINVQGVVDIAFAHSATPVFLSDWSMGGFAILTGHPIAVGTVEEFRVTLPGYPAGLVSAQATHWREVEPGVYLSGWMAKSDSVDFVESLFEHLTRAEQEVSFTS